MFKRERKRGDGNMGRWEKVWKWEKHNVGGWISGWFSEWKLGWIVWGSSITGEMEGEVGLKQGSSGQDMRQKVGKKF
jgi:hypothetical protein